MSPFLQNYGLSLRLLLLLIFGWEDFDLCWCLFPCGDDSCSSYLPSYIYSFICSKSKPRSLGIINLYFSFAFWQMRFTRNLVDDTSFMPCRNYIYITLVLPPCLHNEIWTESLISAIIIICLETKGSFHASGFVSWWLISVIKLFVWKRFWFQLKCWKFGYLFSISLSYSN